MASTMLTLRRPRWRLSTARSLQLSAAGVSFALSGHVAEMVVIRRTPAGGSL
jgi:hypothetical protein